MIPINKKTGFTPIYEGTKPNKTNVVILKDYNGQRKKLTYCHTVQQSGICKARDSPSPKNSVNTDKLQNNLTRARTTIYELALCNDWEWFITITLNAQRYDRYNLPEFRKDFSRFIRTYGKKNGLDVKYLVIPEKHVKGGWHMHGFLKGIPPDNLRHFTLYEKLPFYLRKKLEQGSAIYDWTEYRERFGFCDIEPVRNLQAASAYVTKYITKSLDSSVKNLGGHLYYASQGLNRATVIKTGKMNPDLVMWDFENEYVKIKWFDSKEQPELLINNDNRIAELRKKRDIFYESSQWETQVDYETGEILFQSPF